MQRKVPARPCPAPVLHPRDPPRAGVRALVLAHLYPCPPGGPAEPSPAAAAAHLHMQRRVTARAAGAGLWLLMPAGTLGSRWLSRTGWSARTAACQAGRGTVPRLGVTEGGEREQVQWRLHTHTWKLFLVTINLLRGCLAPPSALQARALTLVGVMPADREGVGEARIGRNSC